MPEYELPEDPRKKFLAQVRVPHALLLLNALAACVYFYVLTFVFPHGNRILFDLLIFGEVFHISQVFAFLYTVWDTTWQASSDPYHTSAVDVFITVAGEPVELVRETVRAAKRMRYRDFTVYVLNDGYVAKKENWHEIELMAAHEGVVCITRKTPGGAKAGNINHALGVTGNPVVAIFDADHVPHSDFLQKTVPYFADPSMGFVQTPQFYKNRETNYLTRSSWEQQQVFYGPICKGKNRLNAVTMCGTNMVIRREALERVGGMCTESIAEDFVTGMFIHGKGYRSVYVPEVLAEGLACEDILSYTKQQFRWARGALDLIFKYNLLFRGGLSLAQRIQYLASATFYFTGLVVFIDLCLPLAFFYTGAVPIYAGGMFLAAVFLPYLFLTLYVIQASSNFTFTFPSLAFSMSSFPIHLRALGAAATHQQSTFSITAKRAITGNFTRLVRPHFAYLGLSGFGLLVAFSREGLSASVVNNLAWVLLSAAIFTPFIRAALPQEPQTESPEDVEVRETLPSPIAARRVE